MAVFRFLSAVFMLVAAISIVVDASPQIYGAGTFHATSLGDQWRELSPKSLEAAEATMSEVAPWSWDSVIAPVLAIPTCVAFGGLALVSGYIGRRRRTVRVFVN